MYNTIYNDPERRAQRTEPWIYWNDVFTKEELAVVLHDCENLPTETGTTFGGIDKEVRDSNVKFHNRTGQNAWIFDRINGILQAANEMYYNFDLNGYDAFQYTTYGPEQHYEWHMDMSMSHNVYQPRKLSMSVLLNDDFEGGEFLVNNGQESKADKVPLWPGRAVIFPSFMIHKVTPVTKGIRKSLVVWVVGPKFI